MEKNEMNVSEWMLRVPLVVLIKFDHSSLLSILPSA